MKRRPAAVVVDENVLYRLLPRVPPNAQFACRLPNVDAVIHPGAGECENAFMPFPEASRKQHETIALAVWLTWLAGERRSAGEWGSAAQKAKALFAFCDCLFRAQLPPEMDVDGQTVTFTRNAFVKLVSEHAAGDELTGSQTDRVLYDEDGLQDRLRRIYSGVSEWPMSVALRECVSPRLLEKTASAFGVRAEHVKHLSNVIVHGYDGRFYLAAATPDEIAREIALPKVTDNNASITVLHTVTELQPDGRAAVVLAIARRSPQTDSEARRQFKI